VSVWRVGLAGGAAGCTGGMRSQARAVVSASGAEEASEARRSGRRGFEQRLGAHRDLTAAVTGPLLRCPPLRASLPAAARRSRWTWRWRATSCPWRAQVGGRTARTKRRRSVPHSRPRTPRRPPRHRSLALPNALPASARGCLHLHARRPPPRDRPARRCGHVRHHRAPLGGGAAGPRPRGPAHAGHGEAGGHGEDEAA
jgi:hypothetical protein